jgi:protein TonB
MQVQSSGNNVPEKYRIALALSTAFLAHTLILTGLPSPIPETQEPRHSIQFELVFPGSRASTPRTNDILPHEVVEETTPNRNPTFKIPPTQVTAPSLPQIVTELSNQRVLNQEIKAETKVREEVVNNPRPLTKPTIRTNQSTQSDAAHEGSQVTVPAEQAEEDRPTRITQAPTEADSYLVKLWQQLQTKLAEDSVAGSSNISHKMTVIIELQLLGNGTLTRARILKSTENTMLDNAIYRAALAASPYPEPPENMAQNRFKVKLVLTPVRL